MRRELTLIILLIGVLGIASCRVLRIDSQETAQEFYPSKPSPEAVEYLDTVNRPHKVIGTVTVNAERSLNANEVIDRMKREAAILGGDALTDLQSDATGTWKKITPKAIKKIFGNAYIRANYTAKVIVFTDSP